MENLVAENTRLRKELKAKNNAYRTLQEEKDEAIKALKQASEKINKLESLLKLKEKLLITVREEKEREVTELMKIKNDLEMRLQSILEADVDGVLIDLETPKQIDLSVSQGQVQLTCAKALETLKKWEGVEELTEQLKALLKKDKGGASWRPGTPWTCTWKPHIRLYLSANDQFIENLDLLYFEVFPQLETFCKSGGIAFSAIHFSPNQVDEFSLPSESILDMSLQEIEKCDLFVSFVGNEVDTMSKVENEYGFLNNPTIKPSVFVFVNDRSTSVAASKLKQRVRKSSSHTTIIDCSNVTEDIVKQLCSSITKILELKYDIFQPVNKDQVSTFSHLTLLADMQFEYEQQDILKNILQSAPKNPICIDLTFERLKAYMTDNSTVAPYLITAPTGSGKTLLLAKWIEALQAEHSHEVVVVYHFVSRSCSSSSESCLMYRRFCHKLMLLYGESTSAPLAVDPDRLEEVFSEWLNKTAASLVPTSGPAMIFFVIDNAELLQDHTQLNWLHKPLPKNVRVVMTANESAQYPDTWRHLASSTLPTPTSTDLQQVIPYIQYGPRNRIVTEDQMIALVIVSQSCFLWCALATRYILSLSDQLCESELDDVIQSLEEQQEIPELVKHILDDFELKFPHLSIATEQILQLIYWSRNGLSFAELRQLLQFPDLVLCFVVNELRNRHVICEIGGLLQFTNENVLEVVQFKYHLDSSPDQLLVWSETLISLFSDFESQLLSRCTEELPWLLKRGELQQDLVNTLLNIDILIQLYCSGQGSLFLKYWRWIGVMRESVPEQYQLELSAIEEQAGSDQSSSLYVAMILVTVGKIFRNMGLLEETQPLLQRALEMYECNCAPESEEVAGVLCELAQLYMLIQKYSAAESFYNQALEIHEQLFGECSDQAISVLEALRKIYQETKKSELLDGIETRLITLRDERKRIKPTAHTLIMKRIAALEKHLNSFESDHLFTCGDIECLNEWAVMHAAFGQENSADDFFFTALKTSEKFLGPDHSQTLTILSNWTTFYLQTNKLTEAITLQERIIELKEKAGEKDEIGIAAAMNNLAVFHCLKANYQGAVPLYDKAIQIYIKHYGQDHPKVQDTQKNRELAADQC